MATQVARKHDDERTDIERALLVMTDYAAAEQSVRGTRNGDVGRIPVTHPAHPDYLTRHRGV